ncbi:MAG: SDR family oxidoreductase [Cyclobacteriaceae bacterium]
MNLNLEGKVYIVTGGTGGIGEAIAKGLAAEGAIPVIIGRSKEKGHRVVKEIEAEGGQSKFILASLGSEDICKPIIEETVAALGRIDGLVNNAGTNDGVGLENGSPAAFQNSIVQNISHYYDLAHYSLPYLKKAKGSIVNISSKTAITGQGGTSGYAASKGAQLSLTREWAVELAKFGIRVNAIIPAEVMTPQYKKWITTFENPEEVLNDIVARIPLENRMTEADEIASMAVFLLSDKSSHTTGQWLFVDGGYVHFDRAMLTNH